MKTNIYIYLMMIFFLFSCKKESDVSTDAGKVYELSLNVPVKKKGFSKLSVTGDTLASRINFLSVKIFKGDGTFVKEFYQAKGDPNFGSITYGLGAGNYNVVVFGTAKNPIWFEDNKNLTGTRIKSECETFYDQFILKVTNWNVTRAVDLKRVSVRGVIHINDPIPSNVKKIKILYANSVYKICPFQSLYNQNTWSDFNEGTFAYNQSGVELSFWGLNAQSNSISVLYLDANNGLVANKIMNGQFLTRDKKAVFSLNMMDNSNSFTKVVLPDSY